MKWQDVTTELTALLGDPTVTQYPDELRIIAWNKAQAFLAITHTAAFKSATASGQAFADGNLFPYPSDFIELPKGGVQMFSNDVPLRISPLAFESGASTDDTGYLQMQNGVYVPGEYTEVRYWYYGVYDPVVNADSTITLPAWAIWPLQNLSMAYMLYPEMMSQQLLRQFQGKREAGSPEDNPARMQAVFCIRLFSELIGRVRPQDRSLLFRTNG